MSQSSEWFTAVLSSALVNPKTEFKAVSASAVVVDSDDESDDDNLASIDHMTRTGSLIINDRSFMRILTA
jgi:hypothetical protein